MRIDPHRFSQTEFVNTSWTLTVEQGTQLDDVKQPEFWSNIAAQLRPYDEIRVRTDDGLWYADLMVLSCGRTWAKMLVKYSVNLDTSDMDLTAATQNDDYSVTYRGPHLKFCIIRKSDKQPIKEELDTREQARAWLAEHLRAIEA